MQPNRTNENARLAPGAHFGKLTQRQHSKRRDVWTSTPPNVELILSRLEGVRRSGAGMTAKCPAHSDRTASLSIAAGDDGRILLHCFAGCGAGEVVAAVGLTIGDLFPRRMEDASPEDRRRLRELARAADLREARLWLDAAEAARTAQEPECHRLGRLRDDAEPLIQRLRGEAALEAGNATEA